MTTNTPNQTLKFPFGETPDEVIRDAAIRMQNDGFNPHLPNNALVAGFFARGDSYQDLLTVLDALKSQAKFAVDDLAKPARELRVAILAALGINEGGE